MTSFDALWCYVVSCGVMGVVRCYVVLCVDMCRHLALCGDRRGFVTLCGVMWCYVVSCGVMGVVRCYVVLCGVKW